MSEPKTIKATRLYSGDDGQSHFEDLWFPLEENVDHPCPTMEGRSIGFMAAFPATDMSFRVTPPGGDHDFHWSPGRSFQLTMSGVLELEVGDGTRRRFGPGDVLIIDEQSKGQGHRSHEIEPRVTVNVSLPLDLDLTQYRTPPS